jgi:predicted RNase H-like HicB family nuclease
MKTKKFVYWEDNKMWVGYLVEFPDYLTQGNSLEELKEHLIDIYHELTSGNIPNARRVDELEIA